MARRVTLLDELRRAVPREAPKEAPIEDRVWAMVARGLSHQLIAHRLRITLPRVKSIIKNRVRRLNSQLEKAIGA